MSTLVDAILAWKARLTTRATPEQILALRADVNAIADYVRFLESENAKLRELCMNLYRAMWACDDSRCPYGGECDDDPDEFMPNCKLKDLMRELGIEVG